MADSGKSDTMASPNDPTDVKETATEKPAQTSAPVSTAAVKSEKSAVQPETPSSPIQQLWSLAKSHDHNEVWGVQLADPESHVPSQIVLQKYLNANDGDVMKAKEQLKKTLDWRKETQPLQLLAKSHSLQKFDGMGFVTTYGSGDVTEVFTWNIYGIVKDFSSTFGDVNEFIQWRVALMEQALQDLSISTATKAITAEDDPYKIFQVHDYLSVSFFRQHPDVKTASKETIQVFAQNYPELLKEKFFVNVPGIMGAIYAFMKLFVAAKTAKKFHPMSNGGVLANEFGGAKVQGLGEMLPKQYGGKGEDLKTIGKTPRLGSPLLIDSNLLSIDSTSQ